MTTLHILDDHLEAYSLGRLAAAATAPAEEHLLASADCRDRLARWDEYIPPCGRRAGPFATCRCSGLPASHQTDLPKVDFQSLY